MSFSKNDLENIKSKIQLSAEIEKKVKVIKKGNDYWCCCPFHEEKTPSCKINNEQGSYYCFGCGAKGDIFTIYTDLYNYTFPDAVKELAKKVGITVLNTNFKQSNENDIIFKILEISTSWFENNLIENENAKKYLAKRSISEKTINDFRIGYSSNKELSLYQFLKNKNFNDEDILKSNVVKIDNNNKIRDFFFNRLIFPISNEYNKIIGFGGRVLDNSNPKYINSPDSNIFKKRETLYNLNQAKKNIRIKKNILICEGYMDVISLHENNIKTAVAPLGTALTESQLLLSWKFVNKPTIMFDGDNAGLRASYKSALMALPYLSPNKFLQFIKLPYGQDPDTYINKLSINEFVNLLKKPISIVNFIFDQSSATIDFNNADEKITFDKYIDDLIETIKDPKIKYFYKNEFKKLFFENLKFNKNKLDKIKNIANFDSLIVKQIDSFILSYLNHVSIRDELYDLLQNNALLTDEQQNLLNYLHNSDLKLKQFDEIMKLSHQSKKINLLNNLTEKGIYQLFPYSKSDNNSQETLIEIRESIRNLNTRLLNLKKINKSLNEFEDNFSSLTWEELRSMTSYLHIDED